MLEHPMIPWCIVNTNYNAVEPGMKNGPTGLAHVSCPRLSMHWKTHCATHPYHEKRKAEQNYDIFTPGTCRYSTSYDKPTLLCRSSYPARRETGSHLKCRSTHSK